MLITPFVHGETFDPDIINAMSQAYQKACRTLGLADRDDGLTRLVGKHIVELAQKGVYTPLALYLRTVEEFRDRAPA